MTVHDTSRFNWSDDVRPLDLIVGGCVCDQCDEHHDPLVAVGERYDWETSTALVCRSCLSRAMDALNAHEVAK